MKHEGATVRPYLLRDIAWLYVPSGLMHAFGGAPRSGACRFDVGCLY